MSLSVAQLNTVAQAGGFLLNEERAIAIAIALAESGGNPTATHKNTNGSTDYGLWQINSIHGSILKSGSWSNPTDNARMAFQVYSDAGRNFTPWSTYKSGRYLAFLSVARRTVYHGRVSTLPTGPAPSSGTSGAGTATAVPSGLTLPNPLKGLFDFVSVATNPNTYIRVAMFFAGFALLIYGILVLTKLDKKIGGALKSAGKDAAIAAVVA